MKPEDFPYFCLKERHKKTINLYKKMENTMQWEKLLVSKRFGNELYKDQHQHDRSEFQRDYDRLIFSAPFRRLQNKTQVFPLPGSVFVHNRLTHSLEVACVGQSLGFDVAQKLIKKHQELSDTHISEIGSIVSAACLAHDLGNPPFGHSGEKAIQTFFTEGAGIAIKEHVSSVFWEDITHFEGNANAFRLLTHRFKGRRNGGFVMTYTCLASIVKYPYSSSLSKGKGKFGVFETEKANYIKIADELGIICDLKEGTSIKYSRHPLVYLVEAADDICYEIMDIEDAYKMRLLTFDETVSLFMNFFDDNTKNKIRERIVNENVTDDNEQIVYMRSCVIGLLVNKCVEVFVDNEENILNGCFRSSLIDNISEKQKKAYDECAALSIKRIYKSKYVVDVELAGYKILNTLMEQMVGAVMNPDKFYSQQLIKRVSSQYEIDSDDLETCIMAVIDYISGMTDVYALDVYQKINGMSLPIV